MAPEGKSTRGKLLRVEFTLHKKKLLRVRDSKWNGCIPALLLFKNRQKIIYLRSWCKSRRIRLVGLLSPFQKDNSEIV